VPLLGNTILTAIKCAVREYSCHNIYDGDHYGQIGLSDVLPHVCLRTTRSNHTIKYARLISSYFLYFCLAIYGMIHYNSAGKSISINEHGFGHMLFPKESYLVVVIYCELSVVFFIFRGIFFLLNQSYYGLFRKPRIITK
jgi:hypothetical protein